MRLIDADALEASLGIEDEDIVFCKMIEDAPTVDLPDALHAAGWKEEDCVSMKDKVPDCEGIYLIWRSRYYSGEIGPVVCYFDGQSTWHADFERIVHPDDITHWIPLPKTPEEIK